MSTAAGELGEVDGVAFGLGEQLRGLEVRAGVLLVLDAQRFRLPRT
jgi:hypothetical protein